MYSLSGKINSDRELQPSYIKARDKWLYREMVNNDGQKYKITAYYNANDMTVEFEDGTILEHVDGKNVKNGKIQNPYFPSLCGFGCVGIGKFKTKENGRITPEYSRYSDMVRRVKQKEKLEKDPSYIGCDIDRTWSDFQVFGAWYEENYYEIEGEKVELDKDLLVPNNRIYAPDVVAFIPGKINKSLRRFRNKEELMADDEFEEYKNKKEELIKSYAEEYKGRVPDKVYKALLNYKLVK